MKKFLKITGIVLLVILAILIALPFLFKDKIAEQIRVVANESLNATLNFSDLSISLFSSFPHATVTLEGLTIDGAGNFESVRLAELGSVSATVNIMSLLGETMQIESVSIANGKLDVRVLENGTANYDIAKSDDSETPEPVAEEEEGSAFALELQSYELVNLDIDYSDATLPMTASIKTLNHSGSGDFTASKTLLETKTSMARLDIEYDKVKYIRKAVVDMIVNLDLDLENMHFVFAQNEVGINDLKLGIDGSLDMPGDDMAMDITFGAKDANFKSLLSLVPAEFATDLKGVEAAGTMSFNGFVKGIMSETSMPGYGIDVKVKDGRFNYPDLPKSVENIQVDMMVDASDGNNFDATVVDIKRFYMEMADNPVDLRLRLTTPESDPNIDCSVQAKVILDNLADVIPLEEGETITGSINADLALKGRMSTIEQEKYEEFDAAGQVILQQVAFRSSTFMYPMDVDVAYLEFTPKALKLNQFEGRIGQSDLQAQGQMDNYLAFALRDELLHGNFTMTSSLLDLNELMGPETEGETTEEAADTTASAILEIPGNIDFRLNSQLDKVLYDDVVIENATGVIQIKDHVADLDNMKMDVLGGQVIMDGTYDTRNVSAPAIAMSYDINRLNVKETAEKFNTIEKLAPIASSCRGKFSTDMTIKATLDGNMEPIENTIDGSGSLQTHSLTIDKFKPLTDLAGQLGISKLANPTLSDMNLSYIIEKGKAIVEPFFVTVEGIKTEVSGSTSLISEEFDYSAKMEIPFEKLPSSITSQASSWLGQLNTKLGTSLSAGDKIPVHVRVTGTMDNPKLTTDYGDIAKNAVQDVKEEIIEEVKEQVQEVIDDTKEKAIEEAKAQADKIMADAQKQADQLMTKSKSEAEKVRQAAYKEADKLENKGANFIEKAANKTAAQAMRSEADKTYDKAVAAAQKESDKILAQAKKEADDIIKQAE